MSEPIHPCLACGACCHEYRVEFSVYELVSMGGRVPDALAHEVHGTRWRMNGTDRRPVRCTALTGACGVESICGIYEQRPGACRDFEMGSERCAQARTRHGLPPLALPWQAVPESVPELAPVAPENDWPLAA